MKKICLTGGIACGKSLVAKYLNELGVETIDADDVVHELIPDPEERRRIAAEVFADPAKRMALEAKVHPVVKERIEEFLAQDDAIPPAASSPCRPCRPSCRLNDEGLSTFDSRLSSVASSTSSTSGTHSTHSTSSTSGTYSTHSTSGTSGTHSTHSTSSTSGTHSNFSTFPPFHLSTSSLPLRLAIIPLLFETHWDEKYDIICCVASERETQISRMMTTRGYTREQAEARLAAQLPVAEKAAKSHYVINNNGTAEELRTETEKFVNWLKNRIIE
jgi:dephospho-CoA kinase